MNSLTPEPQEEINSLPSLEKSSLEKSSLHKIYGGVIFLGVIAFIISEYNQRKNVEEIKKDIEVRLQQELSSVMPSMIQSSVRESMDFMNTDQTTSAFGALEKRVADLETGVDYVARTSLMLVQNQEQHSQEIQSLASGQESMKKEIRSTKKGIEDLQIYIKHHASQSGVITRDQMKYIQQTLQKHGSHISSLKKESFLRGAHEKIEESKERQQRYVSQ